MTYVDFQSSSSVNLRVNKLKTKYKSYNKYVLQKVYFQTRYYNCFYFGIESLKTPEDIIPVNVSLYHSGVLN
jgi:hypothetical protein